jgi:hypothetical protein
MIEKQIECLHRLRIADVREILRQTISTGRYHPVCAHLETKSCRRRRAAATPQNFTHRMIGELDAKPTAQKLRNTAVALCLAAELKQTAAVIGLCGIRRRGLVLQRAAIVNPREGYERERRKHVDNCEG